MNSPLPRTPRPRALRRICYGTLALVSAVGLLLWSVSDIDPLDNAAIADTIALAAGLGALFAVTRALYPRIEPQITMPWLRTLARQVIEAFELLMFYRWLPAAITATSYLVLPYSLPLVDPLLAWPEERIGLPHWRTYPILSASSVYPLLEQAYGSVDKQLIAMLLFFVLIRRDLTRLWEYTAIVAVTGALSIVFLWAMPAEGPWAYFHDLYPALPPEPDYLSELKSLRAGALSDPVQVYGMLNFPSFHTVFALLIAWTLRGHGLLSVAVWLLDITVVLATVPVGWHYLVDVLGGIAFTAFGIWVVARLSTGTTRTEGAS